MRKKRVLFLSNSFSAKTGFGGFMRELLLEHLFPLKKYELALIGSGLPFQGHQEFLRYPIKCYGTVPTHLPHEIEKMNADPNYAREVNYGMPMIDEAIKDFKPDVVVSCEDIWANAGLENKKWLNKLSTVIHTTLDSVPILPRAYELAKHVKHFYVWSEFAEREMKKRGAENVKTIHGSVNTKVYRRLPEYQRTQLRAKWGLDRDTFVIGMLSRNQLRKLFLNSMEGYDLFKKQNPHIKTKLLFFTHYGEGWNLEEYRQYLGLKPEDILCCYKCRATKEYFVMPFQGQEIDNPVSGHKKSLVTVNTGDGLTEEQVNEWYNLLDVHVHPITSGALERSVGESKLTEIPNLINPYSCFEDQVGPKSGAIELQQSLGFEIGTNFKKSNVSAFEIAKQLKKVYEMGPDKRREIGKEGRQFVLDNYSIEHVGRQFEGLLDSLPLYEGDFDFWTDRPANPHAQIPNVPDNTEFVVRAYKDILCWEKADGTMADIQGWVNSLNQGYPRQDFINTVVKAAYEHNAKLQKPETPAEWLEKQGVDTNTVLLIQPKSLGDIILITSIFRSLKEQYPNKKLILACEPKYFEAVEGNPYLDKVIPYVNWLDNQLLLQGIGNNKPLVHKSIHSYFGSQRQIDYIGPVNFNFELNYKD